MTGTRPGDPTSSPVTSADDHPGDDHTSDGKVGGRFQSLTAGGLSISAIWSMVGSLGGAAGRFALQAAIANLLDTDGYGRFVTLRTWGEMLATIPNRGYQGVALSQLPGYAASGDSGSYRGLIRHSRRSTLAVGVALAAMAAAAGTALGGGLGISLLLAMATVPAWAMLRLMQALLQAQDRFVTANFIGQMLQPAFLALIVGTAWLLGPVDVPIALGAMLGSLILAAAVASTRSASRTYDLVGPGVPSATDPAWSRAARSFFLGQLSISVIATADVLVLAMFVSEAEVGLYAMASRIAILGRLPNSGLESIVSPRIAKAWSLGSVAGIQSLVGQSIALSSGPTIGLAAFLVVFREPILGIVGDEYRVAGTYLVILLVGNVVNALTGPSGYVVSLTGNERLHGRIMSLAAAGLVVGCLVAGSAAGALGVAIVRSLVTVGWNLALVFVARTQLGVRCYPSRSMLS